MPSEPYSMHDPSPEYRPGGTLGRSDSVTSGASSSQQSSVSWSNQRPLSPLSSPGMTKPPSILSRKHTRLPSYSYTDLSQHSSNGHGRLRPERYVYTYCLVAGAAPLQFVISVEPASGRPTPGRCTFRLSLKVDKVERSLGPPTILNLAVDPRALDFVCFVFPGKSSLPMGCLWSYRIWLRVNGVEHRIFGDDELWVAKDPDFTTVADASYARIKNMTNNSQIYDAFVGKAHVQFIVKYEGLGENLYKFTIEYDANGVGGVLVEDFKLVLEGDPRKATFLIYSVPMPSMPAGASHRIRIWLKTFVPVTEAMSPTSAYSSPYNESFIYQRIWKTDTFKLGARLDFGSLGSKMITGFASSGGPKTVPISDVYLLHRYPDNTKDELGSEMG